jgi:hypothetical protein
MKAIQMPKEPGEKGPEYCVLLKKARGELRKNCAMHRFWGTYWNINECG